MACTMENEEQGYDERRFEGPVRQDLFCSICQEVLRDPRTCQNKEHPFCLSCISQHLRNSHTCPECREHLTPETLKDPPRFLKNIVSELKIQCDYNERGCPGYVQLGNLQNHVDQCGFAPVMCPNEGCGTEVNKRDKEIHERELCQFRIAKWHDYRDIKASQDEMRVQVLKMERKQDHIMESQAVVKVKIEEMEIKQDDIKESQAEMKVQIEEIERKQDEIKKNDDEIKQSQAQMRVELNEIKVKMKDQMKVNEMKNKITEMERTQGRMKLIMMIFMMIMVQQALQGSNVNNNRAQALDPAVPANNQDIIILGGYYAPGPEGVSDTVEKFNIVEGKSTQLPRMNLFRADSASCVYNGDVIVAGGHDGETGTDLIEILKMNQHPLRWTILGGKLPAMLSYHDVIVYQDKLYFTGGYDWREWKKSDAIYELALTPPYTAKLLARMPQPRRNHRTEIVNGKLFILGGITTFSNEDPTDKAVDTVLVYDFIKNEFKPCTSLPKPVRGMSTVTWGNMIIVVGGVDKNDQTLNDVIMYDTETGGSERLPSLKHKRCGSSAVIMHDVIVVLGGWDEEQGDLNSVESFTMGDYQWKELPGMTEKRGFATAVVTPRY